MEFFFHHPLLFHSIQTEDEACQVVKTQIAFLETTFHATSSDYSVYERTIYGHLPHTFELDPGSQTFEALDNYAFGASEL